MAESLRARPLSDGEVEERLGRLDELLTRLEQTPGPTAETALDAVALLSEVYGTALARVMAQLDAAPDVRATLARDQLLHHLLILHGIHPDTQPPAFIPLDTVLRKPVVR